MTRVFKHTGLRAAAARIFRSGGSEPAEAEQVADHLVEANLKGHDSHGIGMIPAYVYNLGRGRLRPNTAVELVQDGGAVLQFDGGHGYGQRTGAEMMETLIERARETGAVVATLRNAHHLGRIGTYTEMAVAAGLVSLHFVNVTQHPPLVAPFRGSSARFSTNPVSIGFPGSRSKEPFLLDMATSQVAMGKIRVAHNKGEQTAPGLLVDHQGHHTTDPGVMFPEPGAERGALLPFGLHKGYGLVCAAEMLAGVLGGGGTGHPANQTWGSIVNSMFVVVVDPERFVDRQWMEREIDQLRDYVVTSPPGNPDEPVLVAGDPERISRAQRLVEGIPVDDTTWSQILDAGEKVGLAREETEKSAAS